MQSSKIDRIKDLVEQLNAASESYYAKDQEIMSNYEYDKLYDELVELEKETGVTLANSPTVNVGYEAVDELPKERHESPMLSLGKTKSREELRDWLQGNPAILSWKLDGLTIVLTYREGKLAKAVTRGNGEIGEVITNNARTFKNLPLNISYTGELILRGEAVITYSDFEKINGEIADAEAKYKNPRNLCSGSVRQLNNEITARRNVRFFAFTLVKADGVDFAMVRIGLRGYSTGGISADAFYAQNIEGAMAAGIETGVYFFAQAITVEEAIEEADFVISLLRDHEINGPVAYDWEMHDSTYRVYGTTPEMATACAIAFCQRIAEAGYTPMIYAGQYVSYIKYDQGAIAPYLCWYPEYKTTSSEKLYPSFYYQMDYWQFSSSCTVDGIGGRVDGNIQFIPR